MSVLAIDQGTTSTRALRVDADGGLEITCSVRHQQHYPAAGRVEHDAEELIASLESCIDSAPDGVPVRLSGPAVHLHPFLYLAGDGAIPPFPEAELGVLRRHLQYGGFLLVDAADGSELCTLADSRWAAYCKFTPDGRYVYVTGPRPSGDGQPTAPSKIRSARAQRASPSSGQTRPCAR